MRVNLHLKKKTPKNTHTQKEKKAQAGNEWSIIFPKFSQAQKKPAPSSFVTVTNSEPTSISLPDCIVSASCGSCYAFASMAMNEARVRIMTNNTKQPVFSPQDIVDCSEYSQGSYVGEGYCVRVFFLFFSVFIY